MPKLQDLTGKRFGRLIVVSRAENKGKYSYWNCICHCNCGNSVKVVVRGSSLVSGHTTSCGCVARESAREAGLKRLKDLTGKRFERLTVISRAENQGKQPCWNCICHCDCGNEVKVVVQGTSLVSGHTKSCGCYNKERLSETHLGFNNVNWKDGITPLNRAIRTSTKYKEWHKAVFERDNYTCQYSGIVGGKLVVHHITPFHTLLENYNITTKEEALECKELWDISNGITLAKKYHSSNSKNPLAFHIIYGNKASAQDFKVWFMQLGRR